MSHIIECKQCGGEVSCEEGKQVAICPFCGSQNTISKSAKTQSGLVNRANYLRRNNEFDKALAVYEELLKLDNTDYEAHWGLVLCHYGIEYVEDPSTLKKIPTCHRARNESIYTDFSYKTALEYAPLDVREVYECEAAQIDSIQKNIIALAQREEKYDVFICYKEANDAGNRTEDSVIAQELEFELTKRGYRVFFARKTLEGKLGSAYEPIIFAALQSARVMVVLGTKPEHFNAVWVKNEWSRYRELIQNGAAKALIPAYRGMLPYDLPQEFSNLQALDMSKLGFVQDLCDGVDRMTRGTRKSTQETVPVNAAGTGTAGIESLLKRAYLFIEEGDFTRANDYLERVLDMDPEEPRAYIGKLMIEVGVRQESRLSDGIRPLNIYTNFNKAVRFADPVLKARYEGYNQKIVSGIEEAKRIEAEKEARRRELEAAEQERKRQERERQMELLRQKRKKRLKFNLIFWPSLLVGSFLLFCFAAFCQGIIDGVKEGKYESAVEMMDDGNFADAATILEKLREYKDSGELLNESYYQQATNLFDEEEYEDAASLLIQVDNYKNSALYLNNIEKYAYESGDYGLALLAWQGGGNTYKLANIDARMKQIRNSIAVYGHVVGVSEDGEIMAAGLDDYGQCDVSGWEDVIAVATGHGHTVGLKSDGTVVATGDNDEGQCRVSGWKDIIAIAAGYDATIGLRSDGTVVAVGDNEYSQLDVSDWTNIVAVAVRSDYAVGLKSNGTVVTNDYIDVSEWRNVVSISASSSHIAGLKSDGTVVAAGSGSENTERACNVSGWDNISEVAAGYDYTVGLKQDGTVVAVGTNKNGECRVSEWTDIIAITAGYSTIGMKYDGTIISAGSDKYGDVSDWDLLDP